MLEAASLPSFGHFMSFAQCRPLASNARLLGVALSVALGLGGGCPHRAAGTLPPLEIAASPDVHAEADFRAARDALNSGDLATASARFRAFIEAWPHDPLAPMARLELGRIDMRLGALDAAIRWFEGVATSPDPALKERGRMYAAVARARAGQYLDALPTLRALVGRTIDPAETALVLSTIALAEAALGNRLAALEARDRELRGELAPDERKAAQAAITELTKSLTPDLELPRAYESLPRDGVAWAEVATRWLRANEVQGNAARVQEIAQDMRDESIPIDEELSALILRAERAGDIDTSVIGAILPLSGRGREVGEGAQRGLMLASGLPSDQERPPNTPRIVFRDDGGRPETARAALEDLVASHRVIAVVGPVSTPLAKDLEQRARELGVPLLSLSPSSAPPTDAKDPVFHLVGSARDEAQALAKVALDSGARRFVMLHAVGGYGDVMRGAFEAVLKARPGTTLDVVTYPGTSTSFVNEAFAVAKLAPDALILADAAARVALLAPALAAKGVWPANQVVKAGEGRAIPWLVPSVGFDRSLIQSSRRYLQGAVFAVPFDPALSPGFTDAYRDQWGAEPNVFSALAYDAYGLIQAALASGAKTRESVATALHTVRAEHPVSAVGMLNVDHTASTPVRLETLVDQAFVPAPTRR